MSDELTECRARLAEAIHFMEGFRHLECRYNDDCHPIQSHPVCDVCEAKRILTRTTRPPILAEVERLRIDNAALKQWWDFNPNLLQHEIAAQSKRAEAAEAQLQIAREDSKRLDWLSNQFPISVSKPCDNCKWEVLLTGKLWVRELRLREAIDAARAQITEKENQ